MKRLLIGLVLVVSLGACQNQASAVGQRVTGAVDTAGEGINEPGLNQYHRGARGGCYYNRTSKAGKTYKDYVSIAKCDRFGAPYDQN